MNLDQLKKIPVPVLIGLPLLIIMIIVAFSAFGDPMDDPNYADGYRQGLSVIQDELGQTIMYQGKSKQEIVESVLRSYDSMLRTMNQGEDRGEKDRKYLEGFQAGVRSVLKD